MTSMYNLLYKYRWIVVVSQWDFFMTGCRFLGERGMTGRGDWGLEITDWDDYDVGILRGISE